MHPYPVSIGPVAARQAIERDATRRFASVTGAELARLVAMSLRSRSSVRLPARSAVRSGARRRSLAGHLIAFRIAFLLAGVSGSAVHAVEPGKTVSPPPGTVQMVALPAVLVNPVPAGAVVVRSLAPQASSQPPPGESGEPPGAGIGTMLMSMMGLVGWIALRRR